MKGMKLRILHWMNDNTGRAVALLLAVGYVLHLLYEMRVAVHNGKSFDWYYISTQALIVFAGAAIAGWAVDLVFTKSEEEAGEID